MPVTEDLRCSDRGAPHLVRGFDSVGVLEATVPAGQPTRWPFTIPGRSGRWFRPLFPHWRSQCHPDSRPHWRNQCHPDKSPDRARVICAGLRCTLLVAAVMMALGTASVAAGGDDGRPGGLRPSADPSGVVRPDGEADRRLLAEIEAADNSFADHYDRGRYDRDMAEAFRRYGLDLDKVEPKVAGERLGNRASTAVLASAIDRWCYARRYRLKAANWRPLAEVARAADPDPWRNSLRDQFGRPSNEALPVLRARAAEAGELDQQPCESLLLLAYMLHAMDDPSAAASVARVGVRRFPGNYGGWFFLGVLHMNGAPTPDLAQAAGAFAKAVALRPKSYAAHAAFGDVLAAQEKFDEAVAEYRARLQKGTAQRRGHEKLDEAIAEYREAVRLKP